MPYFGGLLIVLVIPLLLGYFIGEKKNISWRNLSLIMSAVGLLILLIPR